MNNDLISREALKKALKSNCDLCLDKNTNWCEHCCPLNDVEDLIENAPTVDTYTIEDIQEVQENALILGAKLAQRPQGEWIIKDISLHKYSYTCPLCKTEYVDNYDGYVSVCDFNFCPNCGADMRGETT